MERNKYNSLQQRFNNGENRESAGDGRFNRYDNTRQRKSEILSSDDYEIGDNAIEYRPKRRHDTYDKHESFNNRKNSFRKKFSDRNPWEERDGEERGDNHDNEHRNKYRGSRDNYRSKKNFDRRDGFEKRGDFGRRDEKFRDDYDDERRGRKDFDKNHGDDRVRGGDRVREKSFSRENRGRNAGKRDDDGLIRLNKFISESGYCSRREADKLIEAGSVSVNGVVVNVLGSRISRNDKVQIGGETLHNETFRYLLLNKPKGYVTTMDDPQKRNTVMQLIEGACRERLFPVGRLDRNTSGLLLFTNDGELANKLMHPKENISKVYHVVLDKPLTRHHLDEIASGIELEDGFIAADSVAYVNNENKTEIGIEIHSGKNHIVRRIFEHLGYTVVKLDRTLYAGLTKKNLPKGQWRFLTTNEVSFLKML